MIEGDPEADLFGPQRPPKPEPPPLQPRRPSTTPRKVRRYLNTAPIQVEDDATYLRRLEPAQERPSPPQLQQAVPAKPPPPLPRGRNGFVDIEFDRDTFSPPPVPLWMQNPLAGRRNALPPPPSHKGNTMVSNASSEDEGSSSDNSKTVVALPKQTRRPARHADAAPLARFSDKNL